MARQYYDFIVIGGGIAGASAAFALSEYGRVVLFERERLPGYHTTGRSAALYTKALGHPIVRALTLASRSFFFDPPDGFSEVPLLRPRGVLFVALHDQVTLLNEVFAARDRAASPLSALSPKEVRAMVPVIRESAIAGAVYEPDGMDIDVHAVHQGFIRLLKNRGSVLCTGAEVRSLSFDSKAWTVIVNNEEFRAPVVVNAAGAWADTVARMAGLTPLGVQPLRRTIIVFDAPAGLSVDNWPAVLNIGERFYFKPDCGRLLASPADETPSEPCDVLPDELDVAEAVERVNSVADLPVRHIRAKWAGLRSFVADRLPVVGFDPELVGFFWLAGQGGFGIKTAPAMARLCACLATMSEVPEDLKSLGITQDVLSPKRIKASGKTSQG